MDRPPYRAAVRIFAVGAARWDLIDGEHAARAQGPEVQSLLSLPPQRLCNMLYTWCHSRIQSQEDLDKWFFELEQPLPGEDPDDVSPLDVDREMDAFRQFTSMM